MHKIFELQSLDSTKMSIRASLEYIVVNYAISECEWLYLEEEHNNIIVGEIDSVTKPKCWLGGLR